MRITREQYRQLVAQGLLSDIAPDGPIGVNRDADKPRSKYGNRKTEILGKVFDSKREADRWLYLRVEELAGRISNLRTQVPYEIVINGLLVCKYIADFVYDQDGVEIVEDVKGFKTQIYRLKKKLMLAVLGIEIKEVVK